MTQREISEIKRRLTLERNNISKIYGCFINKNKEKISMQEVSDRSGFNSISTFNRSFTKYVGMTPSQYASRKR